MYSESFDTLTAFAPSSSAPCSPRSPLVLANRTKPLRRVRSQQPPHDVPGDVIGAVDRARTARWHARTLGTFCSPFLAHCMPRRASFPSGPPTEASTSPRALTAQPARQRPTQLAAALHAQSDPRPRGALCCATQEQWPLEEEQSGENKQSVATRRLAKGSPRCCCRDQETKTGQSAT